MRCVFTISAVAKALSQVQMAFIQQGDFAEVTMSHFVLNSYVVMNLIYGTIDETCRRTAKMYAELCKTASTIGALRVDKLPPLSCQALVIDPVSHSC